MLPETRFTQSGEISIAYQVMDDGPLDLLIVPGFISHLEQAWEDPAYSRFLQHLASFSWSINPCSRHGYLSNISPDDFER